MKVAAYVFATILLTTMLWLIKLPSAMATTPNLFMPDEKPYNLTYADHIKNFWKWILAIPATDNPINDPTGEKCAVNQDNTSSVFYLAFNNGGSSQRVCTVPAGKGLFIPVMQAEDSTKEDPKASLTDLNSSVTNDQNSVNTLYLKIGNIEYNYNVIQKYRTNTGPFDVTYPNNAIFGVIQGGPAVSVADGYYIITHPLAKGVYPIHFKASLLCSGATCVETNFAQDITYTIIAR